MENLQLENQDIHSELKLLNEEIQLDFWQDEAIIDKLNKCIAQLGQSDQERVISFLEQAYEQKPFLQKFKQQHKQNQTQIDYNKEYRSLFQAKKYEQIIDLMKNQNFWKEIKILSKFSQHSTILMKLSQRILDFLAILEDSENNSAISQYQLFKFLLGFIYNNPLSGEEQQTLEQLIGSLLTKQIFEFQDYLDSKLNEEGGQEFIEMVQLHQMKQNMQDQEYQFLFKLFTQDIFQARLNLDVFFTQTFQLTFDELNCDKIMFKLDEAIRKKQQFNECYFSVIIYYWIQYSQQIKQNLCAYFEQSTILNQEKKRQYFEIFIKRLKKNDEITIYFLKRIVLFTPSLEQSIALESYKNYKNNQSDLIKQLEVFQFKQFSDFLTFSIEQIQEVHLTIQKLTFHSLHVVKSDDQVFYLLKIFLWKEQIDLQSLEFLLTLLKQKHIGILATAQKIEEKDYFQKGILIDILAIATLYYNQDYNNFLFIQNFLYEYGSLSKINNEILDRIVKCHYLYSSNLKQQFEENCFDVFKYSQDIYHKWMVPFNFFNIFRVKTEFFCQKMCISAYPENLKFTLEQFNMTLSEQTDEEKYNVIKDWIVDLKDSNKFSKLIPFFFNIIKRDESPESITNLIYKCYDDINQKKNDLNMKALFQLLYNNSNVELQVILLKLYSKQNPVPFIYKNPKLELIQVEEDLFTLNHNLYFIIPQGYTIINLTLSKKTSQIGKTDLINQIFYEKKKFEIQDRCEINNRTIDIMFDFSFDQTRFLTIADAHGTIPLSILQKILPFFQVWIIQMNTESELQENFDGVKQLQQRLPNIKPLICFIVRNSVQDKITQNSSLINDIKNQNISIHFIKDLKNCNQDEGDFKRALNQVKSFLYDLLKPHYNNKENFRGNKQFYELFSSFKINSNHLGLIEKTEEILTMLEVELSSLITQKEGFFCKTAFPIRNIQEQIKNTKNEIAQIYLWVSPSKDLIQTLLQQISDLENQIKKQTETQLIKLFRQALQHDNAYILYLQFQDFVQQFNHHHTFKILEEIKELNDLIREQKQVNKAQKLTSEYQQLKDLIREETMKYIDIQLFWRELLSLQSFGENNQINLNLVNIVYQLLKQGEFFEFVDGDNLRINFQFLKMLAEKFKEQKEGERVLVLSVLGSQSSGKSTILNKIFGCHFITSQGRCTKGINLQLLNIHDQKQFDNIFDYILLLDSEGLQSPNKQDPEFDKKIALLLLSVSDIILIISIGSLTQQFKELIEMCIYTLGQMKSSQSFYKHLSWYFNQQIGIKDKDKSTFLKEFDTIQEHLNDGQMTQHEEDLIDYSEILDINDKTVQLLGMALSPKSWGNEQGFFQNWISTQIEDSFSKQAYECGLKTLQYFCQKLGQKYNKSLNSLEKVFKDIYNNLESLIKLPDLLEFSELQQLQKNEIMRLAFENALKSQDIRFIQSIAPQIQSEVNHSQTQSLKLYNDIQKRIEELIKQELSGISKNVKKQLEDTESQNEISKKITMKYLDQLDQRIRHLDYECRFIILEKIKAYERDFQEREGFQSIDDYIYTLRPQDLKQYQIDPKSIEIKFNDLWMRITEDSVKQHQQIFLEFQLNEFKSIKQAFPKYSLNSEKEQHYINYFIQYLNALDPFQNTDQEKDQIFNLFTEEQTQELFFVFDKQNQYYKFSDIFFQPIKKKLKSFNFPKNKQLLNFDQVLEYEIEFTLISKNQLNEYLKKQFSNDLINFIQNKKNNVKLIKEFINTLLATKVSFDENSLSELISYLMKDEMYNIQSVCDLCNQFSKTLTFNVEKLIQIKNESIYHGFYTNYPKISLQILREKITQYSQKKQRKYEVMIQNIIIKKKLTIKPSERMQEYNPFIQYLISPQDNQQFQSFFRQKFPQIFNNEIMKINNSWRTIHFKIYEIIQDEMTSRISQTQTSENNSVIFSVIKISIIMKSIEQEIKNYCNQLSMFGVIFTSIGERLIYYCCLFIIWRFICYQKWQSLQNLQNKFAQMKKSQFEKFQAEIQQNKHTQSILKAKILAETIQQGIITNFYQEKKQNVKEYILNKNQSNFELVKFLDLELLEKLPEGQHEEIMEYITEQKEYIRKYVDKKIKEIQIQILADCSSQLQVRSIKIIKSVLQNALALDGSIKDSQTSKEYFQSIEHQNDEYYDSSLYKIVLSYLQGQKDSEINNLKKKFQTIFQKSPGSKVIPLANIQQIKSNSQIQILKSFMEELILQLKEILSNFQNIKLDFDKFGVQNELDLVRRNMIGCQEMCPLCNRKCDQTIEVDNHRHMCQNGHQLRGMNQVLIENRPSLCTCEEIEEDDMILIKEINAIKTWLEIKKIYPEWQFRKLEITVDRPFLQVLMNVWNSQIGQKICNKLERQLKKTIPYQFRYFNQRIYQQSIHLIFVLDCSGSMVCRWSDIKGAVIDSLKEIQHNQNARVSVIIFNHEAQVTIDCEKIDIKEQWKKLTNRHGDTNFIEAFKALKNQMEKSSIDQFSRTIIFLYTDCDHDEVNYPKEELEQITQLTQKQQTTFIACTNQEISPVLLQIKDYLRQHFYSAELMEAIDGNLIKEAFVEKLSNKKLRF